MSTLTASPEYGALLRKVAPKVIRTEKENEAYTEILYELDQRAKTLTAAEKELAELLTLLIEDFEEKRYRRPRTKPLEVVRFLMEQHGLLQKDLVDVFGTSRDDDAANQNIVGIGDFFAAAFHVFKAQVDGFADVGEGFGHGLSLGIAAGDGRTNYDITGVVLIGLEKYFEIAGSHGVFAPFLGQWAMNKRMACRMLFLACSMDFPRP